MHIFLNFIFTIFATAFGYKHQERSGSPTNINGNKRRKYACSSVSTEITPSAANGPLSKEYIPTQAR
jgi:hypothetical protein